MKFVVEKRNHKNPRIPKNNYENNKNRKIQLYNQTKK